MSELEEAHYALLIAVARMIEANNSDKRVKPSYCINMRDLLLSAIEEVTVMIDDSIRKDVACSSSPS